jgi:hypothetical protein
MTIEEARQVERAPIEPGKTYTFYSCSVADPDITPRHEQTVTVLAGPHEKDDPEQENMYRVRFEDGYEGDAYEGELNGWFRDTGQYVGHPSFMPSEVA